MSARRPDAMGARRPDAMGAGRRRGRAGRACRLLAAGLAAWAGPPLAGWATAQAQILQQYLPDVVYPPIGQAGATIAPDTGATPRGPAELQPGTTVTTRRHPDFDAPGVHVGDFYIRPELNEGIGYNSNLFADRSGRGALMVKTTPSVSFASDWANASLAGGVRVDNTTYPTQSSQSTTDWTVNLGGGYVVGRDQLQAQYRHGDLHLARGTLNAGNFDRPIAFQADTLHLGVIVPFARLSFEPSLDLTNFRFQNGTLGGQPLIETVNNRNVGQLALTTRYELAPLRNLVVVARGMAQDYYDRVAFQPTQNSKSAEVLAGIDFDFNTVFRVRALVGYEQRSFTSRAFKKRTAPVVDADVSWSPTLLTTLTVRLNRSIEDSLSTPTNGFTYTSVRLSVDHELLRNVLLNAHTQLQTAEYANQRGSETIYSIGAAATWQLNRNVSLTGQYDYGRRHASVVQGFSYTQNVMLLSLGLRL